MWEFVQTNPFVVGALTGSLAAYLLGLLVSHLRREKRWLGYSVNSRNIVQSGLSKLSIQYDGKQIERLDSHQVEIRNIGNRPLKDLPVQIESREGGHIFEHDLTTPDGSAFSIAIEGNARLVVTVDLLNPGEVFSVGMTIADAQNEDLSVVARAELLKVKRIGPQISSDDLIGILEPSIPFPINVLLDLTRVIGGRSRI